MFRGVVVAQGTVNAKVVGSNPTGTVSEYFSLILSKNQSCAGFFAENPKVRAFINYFIDFSSLSVILRLKN